MDPRQRAQTREERTRRKNQTDAREQGERAWRRCAQTRRPRSVRWPTPGSTSSPGGSARCRSYCLRTVRALAESAFEADNAFGEKKGGQRRDGGGFAGACTLSLCTGRPCARRRADAQLGPRNRSSSTSWRCIATCAKPAPAACRRASRALRTAQ